MDRQRRQILTVVGTSSIVALAGCSGSDDGGSKSSCETPTDTLADSFPDTAEYTVDGEITTMNAENQENTATVASAFYTGPSGAELIFQITEYSSETVAADRTDTVIEQGSGYSGAVGYIQTGAYIFSAIGSDEASVEEILKASPTLSERCVEDNVGFA
ncbi:hypothetical protein [Halovenus marina]|uniref:hypothetical protein n=1 Tax=Halovenus marina TaxID=3396621 RepID=UPI003F550C7D